MPHQPRTARPRPGTPRGFFDRPRLASFTIIEIAVAVLIIGILANLALPVARRAADRARTNAFLNDLRVYSEAFNRYDSENGKWPPRAGPGVVPAGMAPYLRGADWASVTPIGGRFYWDRNVVAPGGGRMTAMISVRFPRGTHLLLAKSELLYLDQKFDDGNLTKGLIRVTYPTVVSYIIQN